MKGEGHSIQPGFPEPARAPEAFRAALPELMGADPARVRLGCSCSRWERVGVRARGPARVRALTQQRAKPSPTLQRHSTCCASGTSRRFRPLPEGRSSHLTFFSLSREEREREKPNAILLPRVLRQRDFSGGGLCPRRGGGQFRRQSSSFSRSAKAAHRASGVCASATKRSTREAVATRVSAAAVSAVSSAVEGPRLLRPNSR